MNIHMRMDRFMYMKVQKSINIPMSTHRGMNIHMTINTHTHILMTRQR